MKNRLRENSQPATPQVRRAYLHYLERHPLAGNLDHDRIIEEALSLAAKIVALTAAEFPMLHEPPALAAQLGIAVERIASSAPCHASEKPSVSPSAFLAESNLRKKRIRLHTSALAEVMSAHPNKPGADHLDRDALEALALSHELFHFLLARYKSRWFPLSLSGRAGALAEEIAAHEFARLSLGHSCPDAISGRPLFDLKNA